jgi:hypothetical protein
MPHRIYTARIVAEGAEYRLEIPHRDWMILYGPLTFMPGGLNFVQNLGVMENYTVAGGIPKNSFATRSRLHLIGAASILQNTINDYVDLLSFDYSCSLESEDNNRGTKLCIRGYYGDINSNPKGFCTLELTEAAPSGRGRIVEIIDIRNRKFLDTDNKGQLKIHRRKANLNWQSILLELLEFLNSHKCKEIMVYPE